MPSTTCHMFLPGATPTCPQLGTAPWPCGTQALELTAGRGCVRLPPPLPHLTLPHTHRQCVCAHLTYRLTHRLLYTLRAHPNKSLRVKPVPPSLPPASHTKSCAHCACAHLEHCVHVVVCQQQPFLTAQAPGRPISPPAACPPAPPLILHIQYATTLARATRTAPSPSTREAQHPQ